MKNLLFAVVVGITACGGSEAVDPPLTPGDGTGAAIVEGDVEYRAETLVMESFPVQIATNLQLTNRSSRSVTVTFPDGCLVLLRVYRDAARTSLAYDMSRVFGCTMALVPVSLQAGQSKIVSAPNISAAKILGDSLPNGTYYFGAFTRPDGTALNLRAGSAQLAQ